MSIISPFSYSHSSFHNSSDILPLTGITGYPYNPSDFRKISKYHSANCTEPNCVKINRSHSYPPVSVNSCQQKNFKEKINTLCRYYSCSSNYKFPSVHNNNINNNFGFLCLSLSTPPPLYPFKNLNSSTGPRLSLYPLTNLPCKISEQATLINISPSPLLVAPRSSSSFLKPRLLDTLFPLVQRHHRHRHRDGLHLPYHISVRTRACFFQRALASVAAGGGGGGGPPLLNQTILSIGAIMSHNTSSSGGGGSLSLYGVAALALGGLALVVISAASVVAVAVVFQPRWLLKIVRKQMPHIFFDHVTKDPMVALTIDDGPNGETTHQILDILRQSDAKATFFLIGQNIDKYPELRDRMYAEGHELGNHTMEDVASWRLRPADFERTLLEVDARLQGFFHHDENGSSMKWFRPGHGWYTRQIRHTIQRHGYRLALGSVYPVDPLFKQKGGPIASYCLWKIYPGAVIVLHDRPQQLNQTIEVLSKMLPELKKRGYQVVTLSQLLKGKDNVTKENPLTIKL